MIGDGRDFRSPQVVQVDAFHLTQVVRFNVVGVDERDLFDGQPPQRRAEQRAGPPATILSKTGMFQLMVTKYLLATWVRRRALPFSLKVATHDAGLRR